MRIGDSYRIVMIFEPAKSEIQLQDSEHGLRNVYEDYNLMAEGRFEVTGLRVEPANPRRESLPAGQTVRFEWLVNAEKEGSFTGDLWLSLRFLPLDGSPASQVPVFVRQVNIRASSLLGLGGPQARLVGGIGIVAGWGLSLDVMIEVMKRWVKKKDTMDRKGKK